jgi:hypothetical protein
MARAARLRRPTLVAAPLFVIGVMGCTAALAALLWGAWHPDDLDTTFTVVEVVSLVVGLGAFVAARGCFVEVDPERRVLRDVVAWITVRRVEQDRIVTARVRAGAWRWFELELADGTALVVAGASPAQFPSRLLPGSDERDLADLDLLMGEDTDERGADPQER